jgi:hypothetical protein
MDLTIWDALAEIISWSIRILFWPVGFVIKFREFFGATLPYLFLGVIALIVAAAALAVLGNVLRGGLWVGPRIIRICQTLLFPLRTAPTQDAQRSRENDGELTECPNDPYVVLGLSPDVSEDELKARYRRLLRQNHPDTVVLLDPKIQHFATLRSQRIIEAYKQIAHRYS